MSIDQQQHSSPPMPLWPPARRPEVPPAARCPPRQTKRAAGGSAAADEETALAAGEALRQAEIEAVQDGADTRRPGPARMVDRSFAFLGREELAKLSIDDLREIAFTLHVPDRSKIVEKSDLIDEICKRI